MTLDEVKDLLGWSPHQAPASAGPSPEAAEELRAAARELVELVSRPGWQRVLDLWEKRLTAAEFDLLSSKSSDGVELIGLQRRARAYRELFDGVQLDIAEAIEAGREQREGSDG
jgi:hypothetical protein